MSTNFNHETRVAVVLARGGSKRIQAKNLQQVGETPLAMLATQVGVSAGLPTYLSSDDDQILGLQFPPEVYLFKRSEETSKDESSSESAVLELAERLSWSDETEIVLLPPTSPLRTAQHLFDFLRRWSLEFEPKGYNQAMAVMATNQDFWKISDTCALRIRDLVTNKAQPRRSQDRETYYIETSAIYLSKLGVIRSGKGFTEGKLALIPIPKIAAVDIDDYEDLSMARRLFEGYM